jgi:hypothetical protein
LLLGLYGAGCWWTPLKGLNYGAAGDPYLRSDQPEIPTRKDQPVFRVVLAGDGGLGVANDPTLALLGKWADKLPGRTQVVYLGDNIYPAGLQNGSRKSGEAILLRQLRATRAPKIFLPGNHDWGYTGRSRSRIRKAAAEGSHAPRPRPCRRRDARYGRRQGAPGDVHGRAAPDLHQLGHALGVVSSRSTSGRASK